jgi:hypothetical protein
VTDGLEDTTADRIAGGGSEGGVLTRILEGDWSRALAAVAPILLAAVIGAQLFLLSVWLLAGDAGQAIGGLDLDTYLRALSLAVAAIFFAGVQGDISASVFSTASSVHAVPLGATGLVVATAWLVLRRSATGDKSERVALAVRVSVLVSLVVLTLALLGRVHLQGDAGTLVADPLTAFVGSLVAMLAVSLLAVREGPLPRPAWTRPWVPYLRPAAVGVGLALILGWLAVVGSALLEAHAHDTPLTDVLKALPAAVVYGPTIGQAGAHIGMLGGVSAGVGWLFGSSADLSLWQRHGLSPWYWLYALIPLVVVVLTTRTALRAVGPQHDEDEARQVALRVGVPFAVLWAGLALLTRIRVGAFVFASTAGIPMWQAIVVPAVLITGLGWLTAGALRSTAAPTPRAVRGRALSPLTLALGYGLAIVILAGSAVAAERLSDGSSIIGDLNGLGDSGEMLGTDEVSAAVPLPATSPTQVRTTLMTVAQAEEDYFTMNNTYTDLLDELYVPIDDAVDVVVERADDQSFCLVGTADYAPDEPMTYDSRNTPPISEGFNC